jgi:hypothetical protein
MLQLKFIIASFLWLVVLVAIGIDLFFGIKKSKSTGEFTHSHGLQRTVQKVINYLAMMLFMLMFDAISPLGLIHDKFNILPLASIVGCIILVWTEFISVREKSEEKFRRKTDKVAKDLLELAMKDENLLKRIKETFKDE